MADSAVSYEVGRLLQVPAKVDTPLICQVTEHKDQHLDSEFWVQN